MLLFPVVVWMESLTYRKSLHTVLGYNNQRERIICPSFDLPVLSTNGTAEAFYAITRFVYTA